jgi:hypothetical protein
MMNIDVLTNTIDILSDEKRKHLQECLEEILIKLKKWELAGSNSVIFNYFEQSTSYLSDLDVVNLLVNAEKPGKSDRYWDEWQLDR